MGLSVKWGINKATNLDKIVRHRKTRMNICSYSIQRWGCRQTIIQRSFGWLMTGKEGVATNATSNTAIFIMDLFVWAQLVLSWMALCKMLVKNTDFNLKSIRVFGNFQKITTSSTTRLKPIKMLGCFLPKNNSATKKNSLFLKRLLLYFMKNLTSIVSSLKK